MTLVAVCPLCSSEVVDETGEGVMLECSACDWAGSYEDAGEGEAMPV